MHSISQWFITEVVPAFSRTLVHSLWQGLVAAILAGIVIAATRRLPAAKRYNGLIAVYALFLVTVAATFFYQIGLPVAASTPSVSSVNQPSAIVIIGNVTTTGAIDESFGTSILAAVNRNATLLVGLWTLLFLAQLTRMAFGLRYVQRVRRQGTKAVTEEWIDWIERASQKLGIRQTVLLLQSERVQVPVALGFLKPVVLVPIGVMTQLNTQQVEAILLHELAHIRRNDYVVNLVQSFADAMFLFNPAIRWISARIREERETCCDNIVVQHTANKKGYVEALVSFSQLPLSPAYAMAIGSNKNHLLNRVKTIITRENSRLTSREQATLVLGMVVMMAFGVLAFKPKEKEQKKEPATEKKHVPAVAKNTSLVNLPPAVSSQHDKKSFTPTIQKHIVDTPPVSVIKITKPIKWKNMSTNINDDGVGKTTQVIATAEDGTVYRLRKTNDEIVSLSVNGREIAKESYSEYYPVIDAIEQARKQRTLDALKAQEERLNALQKERATVAQKLATVDESRAKALYKEREEINRKLSEVNEKRAYSLQEKQNGLQNKKEALQQYLSAHDLKKIPYRYDSVNKLKQLNLYEQKQQLYNENHRLYNQKLLEYNQNKHSLGTNSNVSAIISELLSSGMADNETKLSFSLNNNEMMVNGKPVDKDSFEKFRKKYIKNSGDSYSYSRNGGTTSTTINIQ